MELSISLTTTLLLLAPIGLLVWPALVDRHRRGWWMRRDKW